MKCFFVCLTGAATILTGLCVPASAGEIEQVRHRCRTRVRGRVVYAAPAYAYDSWSVDSPSCAAPGYGAPMHVAAPDVAPPPGTLGRTYQLPSRPVPADTHPRVAMLDIRVPGAEEVVVIDTNEFREEDYVEGYQDEKDPALWHFETKALSPGLPHVYRVESRRGGKAQDVRYVRLVRGRILEVNF
jgi:hypothetical protein